MGQSIIDRYIVATFAIWAGDIDYGQNILQ